jgi:hypothetical protein
MGRSPGRSARRWLAESTQVTSVPISGAGLHSSPGILHEGKQEERSMRKWIMGMVGGKVVTADERVRRKPKEENRKRG